MRRWCRSSCCRGVSPDVRVFAPAGDDVVAASEAHRRLQRARRESDAVERDGLHRGRLPGARARVAARHGQERSGTARRGRSAQRDGHLRQQRAQDASTSRSRSRPASTCSPTSPWSSGPATSRKLEADFATAKEKGVLLYDIMTERFEITTMLQRALSQQPKLFGTLEKGTPDNPSITKISVHNFSKVVAGAQLKRPQWFFDPRAAGRGHRRRDDAPRGSRAVGGVSRSHAAARRCEGAERRGAGRRRSRSSSSAA